jgi:hypothetical protein
MLALPQIVEALNELLMVGEWLAEPIPQAEGRNTKGTLFPSLLSNALLVVSIKCSS